MSFWAQNTLEPKRSFRFIVSIGGDLVIPPQYIKSVKKPTFKMDNSPEHKFIQHTFKYPGRVTWDDTTISMVDPGGGDDMTKKIMGIIFGSGYQYPSTFEGSKTSISKVKANKAMGQIFVKQIDDLGNTIEEWTLHNAFIKSVDFGDLSYEKDDIVNYSITIAFDYAVLSK